MPKHRITKRAFLGGAAATAGALVFPATKTSAQALRGALSDFADPELTPGAPDDQSAAFTRALQRAAAAGRPLFLPPGRYLIGAVTLPPNAYILGVPGESVLTFAGGPFMLRAQGARRLRLDGVTLNGDARPLDRAAGALLEADDVAELAIDDCRFTASGAHGVRLRDVAGRVTRSAFDLIGGAGINVDQSRGMEISGNRVADCGDTGILVQRDSEGADNSIVTGNRVERIRADSGGTGQNGNGINLDKANGVIVSGNRVDECAFSAIRCFSSDSLVISDNIATRLGEMALYVEFTFEGAVVANNLIDGAVGGMSLTNFAEHGGRLATVSGNVVRRISGGPAYPDGNRQIGAGISAEADIAITGNVVEDAEWGLQLGWGPYLRNVTATGNVLRRTKIGVGVSVVEGAGPALIANNLIAEAEHGAILGMRWEAIATGELADGGETVPGVRIEGNEVR